MFCYLLIQRNNLPNSSNVVYTCSRMKRAVCKTQYKNTEYNSDVKN